MGKNEYLSMMLFYAQTASAATGIPVGVILAQWAHETGYGSSSISKNANNHAGIKSNSSGRDYVSGQYAGYNSISSFVQDYVRLLVNLPYYEEVITVARSGGSPDAVIEALDRSPWATDPLYGSKLKSVYRSAVVPFLSGSGGSGVPAGSSGSPVGSSGIGAAAENGQNALQLAGSGAQYGGIFLALGLIALVGKFFPDIFTIGDRE